MPRANAMVPPDAIRIEDEVWQEAFARREPARSSRGHRLRAIDEQRPDWLLEAGVETAVRPSTRTAAPATAPSPGGVAVGDPAAPPVAAVAAPAGAPLAARRTIKIQGRGAERNLPWPDTARSRPPRRAYERHGFRPDRLAMWAVLLGFLLVLVAVVSGHS